MNLWDFSYVFLWKAWYKRNKPGPNYLLAPPLWDVTMCTEFAILTRGPNKQGWPIFFFLFVTSKALSSLQILILRYYIAVKQSCHTNLECQWMCDLNNLTSESLVICLGCWEQLLSLTTWVLSREIDERENYHMTWENWLYKLYSELHLHMMVYVCQYTHMCMYTQHYK